MQITSCPRCGRAHEPVCGACRLTEEQRARVEFVRHFYPDDWEPVEHWRDYVEDLLAIIDALMQEPQAEEPDVTMEKTL